MNKLHLSLRAQDDLSEIKTYIANDLENSAAAARTVASITQNLRILRNHAFAGARLSSIANVESDYRYLVCGNYLAFYRVSGTNIFIDRILYGRRDYMRILFNVDLDEDTNI